MTISVGKLITICVAILVAWIALTGPFAANVESVVDAVTAPYWDWRHEQSQKIDDLAGVVKDARDAGVIGSGQ